MFWPPYCPLIPDNLHHIRHHPFPNVYPQYINYYLFISLCICLYNLRLQWPHLLVQHKPLLLRCHGCSHRSQTSCSGTPTGNSHYHGNPDAHNGRQNLGWSWNTAGLYQSHCMDSIYTEIFLHTCRFLLSRQTSYKDHGYVIFKKLLCLDIIT